MEQTTMIAYGRGKRKGGEYKTSVAPTITSNAFEQNNFIAEPTERFFKQALKTAKKNKCEIGDTINAFNETIDKSGVSPTITTRPEGFKTAILPIDKTYRIRKLTPLECLRLMGFNDEDYEKVRAIGMSDSQIYKQAGNSIVVNVLEKIFEKMI